MGPSRLATQIRHSAVKEALIELWKEGCAVVSVLPKTLPNAVASGSLVCCVKTDG